MVRSKLILVFAFLLTGLNGLSAQIHFNGIPLDSIYSGKYLLCHPAQIKKSLYLRIEIDKEGKTHKQYLTDNTGERILFETPVGILNYMDDHGWEILSLTDSRDSSFRYRQFWFRRKD